jgi:hypothetical protein
MAERDADSVIGIEDSAVDKFYRGTIVRLFRGSQRGVVRSQRGREIPFRFSSVVTTGPLRRFDSLREGMEVGFDVGWTSKGLCVTVLRVLEPPVSEEGGSSDRSRS